MPPTARRTAAAKAVDPANVTVTPAPGVTKTYPDMTAEWALFVAEFDGHPRLRSSWEFMRNATMVFQRDRNQTAVEGWCHLDDLAVAYFVRAIPRPGTNGRHATYTILGAVRLDEIHEPSHVAQLNPDLDAGAE